MNYIYIILVAFLAIHSEFANSAETGLSKDGRNTADSVNEQSSGLGTISSSRSSTGLKSKTTKILKTKEGKTTSYSDVPRQKTVKEQNSPSGESEVLEIKVESSSSLTESPQQTSSSSTGETTVLKTIEGATTTYSDVPSQQTTETQTGSTSEIIQIDTTSGSVSLGSESTLGAGDCKVESIGVNTDFFAYYSAEMPLKDLAKMAMPWRRPWGSDMEDVKLDLDSNGYLKTVDSGGAQTIVSDDNWGRSVDDNKYVVLYDGEGKLGFNLNGTKIIKEEPGRIEIELGKGRTGMTQSSTNLANYLRNIRIVPLENEGDYQEIITREKYRNVWQGAAVVRYLNAQGINNSKEVKWSDRQKRTTFGAMRGQSLEDIIQMSNETSTHPWILVPHLADDNYITEMAIYARDHLNPNLKIYLEYTNEAWNAQFTQYHYLKKLSAASGDDHPISYGKMAKNVFEIWTIVFGGNSRLVRVIGSQKSNAWVSSRVMMTPGLAGLVDALAVTGYIGIPHSKFPEILGMSDDEVFSYLTDERLAQSKEWLTAHKQIADTYNVKLIAYEAGQHLAPVGVWRGNQEFVDRLINLNRHPKMYQLYMDIYKQWTDAGGELIVWFQTSYKPSKWGSWGLLEYTGQDPQDAPKFQAYKQILRNNGC